MPWVPDSRQAGYLGPTSSPTPLQDDAWVAFLHDLVAGVTGLDGSLVRPLWQPEPPNRPDISTDWVGVGVTGTEPDWLPAIVHVGTGDGYDAFQRMEKSTVLCAFYGPHAEAYCGLLRDGLCIDQNLAELRRNSVGFVECTNPVRNAERIDNRWWNRVDTNLVVRREIRRNYPVLSLLRARGVITANPPTVADTFDTINEG